MRVQTKKEHLGGGGSNCGTSPSARSLDKGAYDCAESRKGEIAASGDSNAMPGQAWQTAETGTAL